jgi:hypothetical protein
VYERKAKVLAPALGAMVLGAATARAADPSAAPRVDDLKQQIQVLQDRVRALESSAEPRAAAPTEEERVSSIVADDADRRSRPFNLAAGGGLTAGYDKGFFIKSDDGNFLLKPAVQFQFR